MGKSKNYEISKQVLIALVIAVLLGVWAWYEQTRNHEHQINRISEKIEELKDDISSASNKLDKTRIIIAKAHPKDASILLSQISNYQFTPQESELMSSVFLTIGEKPWAHAVNNNDEFKYIISKYSIDEEDFSVLRANYIDKLINQSEEKKEDK